MNKTILILFLLASNLLIGQNNAPITSNDTIFIGFNDSLYCQQYYGWATPTGNYAQYNNNINLTNVTSFSLLVNDVDPDGDFLYIDTAYYNNAGYFNIAFDTINPTFIRAYINYKPSNNFWGLDSALFVIIDNGTPAMYDTSTIYFFVKRLEFEHLNLNNISARIGHDAIFTDPNSQLNSSGYQPFFEVPKGSGKHTITGAYLWVGGKNQDSIYTHANRYITSDQKIYGNSGPIMDAVYYKNHPDFDWDRVWKIYANDINYHINNWTNGGYQPPQVFLDWPAHGDTAKGQAFYLAPFVDNNGDGIYNPYDGDYPKIKGQQAIYFIYNNEREQNLSWENENMKTEVHGMAYAYHCPSDSAIFNTAFLDYTIYNRSSLTFDSTIIGFMANLNLGMYWDDHMCSDVNRSTYYAYNSDLFDESDSANNIIGYGANLPIQAVTFLKGAKQDNDGMDNNFGIGNNETINGLGFGDGIADNEYWGMERFKTYTEGCGFGPCFGNPFTKYDFYRYLKGQWDDGGPLVYGGNGNAASSGGMIPTRFHYPDTSDTYAYGTNGLPQPQWSEILEGYPGGDKKGVGTTGPFTFNPDSSVSITIALTFAQNYQNTGQLASLAIMQERVDSIRSYFATDFVSVCGGTLGVNDDVKKENILLVYPNPSQDWITVSLEEGTATSVTLRNSLGQLLLSDKTPSTNQVELDLSSYPTGIYFLQLEVDGHVITKKIIKN